MAVGKTIVKKGKGKGNQMNMMTSMKKPKGSGGKGKVPAGVNCGEVRFESAGSARKALNTLNGSLMSGSPLTLQMSPGSKDETKLLVSGLPDGVEWQELKDHFASIGNLAFVDVLKPQRGEVRFATAALAEQAMEMTNGNDMATGGPISVQVDPGSKDGTKLVVTDIPIGTGWQDLKDHFTNQGITVEFCDIHKGPECAAEVRYGTPALAQHAASVLNGSVLLGDTLSVRVDPGSMDGTKVLITGLSPGAAWQNVKDHFAQAGTVEFTQVMPAGGKGGRGKGGKMQGMNQMMQMMQGGMGKGGNMQGMNQMMQMMQMMKMMQMMNNF